MNPSPLGLVRRRLRSWLVVLVLTVAGSIVAAAQPAPADFRGYIAYKDLTLFEGFQIDVYRTDGTFGTLFAYGKSGTTYTYTDSIPQIGTYNFTRTDSAGGTLEKVTYPNQDGFSAHALVFLRFSDPAHATGMDGYFNAKFVSSATREEMVNTSNRSFVPAGKSSIAGFVVNGTRNRWVLVRAVGPGLKAFGVTGALADPKLQVTGAGNVSFTATSWGTSLAGSASLKALKGSYVALGDFVGAFPLDQNSDDAILFVQLAPGVYSAVVSSTSGTKEGEVLTEVYVLP